MRVIFQLNGFFCIAVLGGILLMLVINSIAFFADIPPTTFLSTTEWQPEYGKYGILTLLTGTVLVTTGAMVIAVPLGIGTALYLSEYAHPLVKNVLKPAIEMLAAVPSVVN